MSGEKNDRRLILGPFNRVEVDLKVRIDLVDGAVGEARVTLSLRHI